MNFFKNRGRAAAAVGESKSEGAPGGSARHVQPLGSVFKLGASTRSSGQAPDASDSIPKASPPTRALSFVSTNSEQQDCAANLDLSPASPNLSPLSFRGATGTFRSTVPPSGAQKNPSPFPIARAIDSSDRDGDADENGGAGSSSSAADGGWGAGGGVGGSGGIASRGNIPGKASSWRLQRQPAPRLQYQQPPQQQQRQLQHQQLEGAGAAPRAVAPCAGQAAPLHAQNKAAAAVGAAAAAAGGGGGPCDGGNGPAAANAADRRLALPRPPARGPATVPPFDRAAAAALPANANRVAGKGTTGTRAAAVPEASHGRKGGSAGGAGCGIGGGGAAVNNSGAAGSRLGPAANAATAAAAAGEDTSASPMSFGSEADGDGGGAGGNGVFDELFLSLEEKHETAAARLASLDEQQLELRLTAADIHATLLRADRFLPTAADVDALIRELEDMAAKPDGGGGGGGSDDADPGTVPPAAADDAEDEGSGARVVGGSHGGGGGESDDSAEKPSSPSSPGSPPDVMHVAAAAAAEASVDMVLAAATDAIGRVVDVFPEPMETDAGPHGEAPQPNAGPDSA